MRRWWIAVSNGPGLVIDVRYAWGCSTGGGSSAEEGSEATEPSEAASEETTVSQTQAVRETTQAPPRSEEEAVADEAKKKAAARWRAGTPPTYEVANVRPGEITSTDLAFGTADVFLTDFGGRPYGVMKNDPVL